ncbi:MAG: phosphotransferase, partial [Bacteroidota bacterium]
MAKWKYPADRLSMLAHGRIKSTLTDKIDPKIHSLKIKRLQGDASNRTYHRLLFTMNGHRESLILMELAEPEGFKKSEEKVTRSAIRVKALPYVNILNHLKKAGVAVPELYYYDRSAGWLFLEDLGDRTMEKEIKRQKHGVVRHFYEQAISELIRIQTRASRPRDKT